MYNEDNGGHHFPLHVVPIPVLLVLHEPIIVLKLISHQYAHHGPLTVFNLKHLQGHQLAKFIRKVDEFQNG